MNLKLTPEFVEYAHDVLVASFLPFDEVINPADYRNRSLIESAIERPFQSAFGEQIWPTVSQKAAALFHSLTCNHCFLNGNKRTALLSVEFFLQVDGFVLLMPQRELYEIARTTASANERGLPLERLLTSLASHFERTIYPVASGPDPKDLWSEHAFKVLAISAGILGIPYLSGIQIARFADEPLPND